MVETSDMSKLSKSLVKELDRRLERYVEMEICACVHEENLVEAGYERKKILKWLEDEIVEIESGGMSEGTIV